MYQIFDIALDSDIPLPELLEVETCKTVIKFSKDVDNNQVLKDPNWFHHWETKDGDVFGSCAKCKEGYILGFPNLVSFIISYKFDCIRYFTESTTPKETIRHLLLDHIIPKILGQQGRLVLHASAVILPNGKAIAFLGNSGWGKSTIASSFHVSGAQLITDDCLLIEQEKGEITGIPNYHGLRLFDDSAEAIFSSKKSFSKMAHYSNKKRLIMHKHDKEYSESKVTFDTFFFLNNPDITTKDTPFIYMKSISGIREFMGFVEKMFILDITDKNINAKQFKNIKGIIASDISTLELHYERKHSMLKEIRATIYAGYEKKID